MEHAVFLQSFFYLSGFLITWPIFFVAMLNAARDDYAFWVALCILSPLQGFWNALIYFNRRLSKVLCRRKHVEQPVTSLTNQTKSSVVSTALPKGAEESTGRESTISFQEHTTGHLKNELPDTINKTLDPSFSIPEEDCSKECADGEQESVEDSPDQDMEDSVDHEYTA
jgi:hypothetical protein